MEHTTTRREARADRRATVLGEELAEIEAARNGTRPDERLQSSGAATESERQAAGAAADESPLRFADQADIAQAVKDELCGLALSGGGIRSATFNLGILQGLAELGLLSRIDYLSTVSGGGYIGAWLTAWAHRVGGIHEVEKILATSTRTSQPEVRFLREHSNYLTPRTGFFGADTWSAISIYLRNLFLNMSILVGVLSAVLLVPRLLLTLFQHAHTWDVPWSPDLAAGTARYFVRLVANSSAADWLAFACLLPAVLMAGIHLRYLDRVGTQGAFLYQLSQQSRVLAFIVAPAFAGAFFIAVSTWTAPQHELTPWPSYFVGVFSWWIALWLLLVVVWNVGNRRRQDRESASRPPWTVFVAAVVAAALSSFLAAVLLGLLDHSRLTETGAAVWMTLGVPVIIMIISASVVLNLGLMGRMVSEEVREWWSRVGGWLLIGSLVWTGFCAVSLFGPLLLDWGGRTVNVSASAAWLATTLFGLLTANSASTNGESGQSKLELAANVAPYVFVAGLLVLLSGVLDSVLTALFDPGQPLQCGVWDWACPHWTEMNAIPWEHTLLLALGVLVAALLLSWRVDINDFSLQPLYRNRLVRCYLGASHTIERPPHPFTPRQPHPFTGFDPDDDIPLTQIASQRHLLRPYPLINTALNLVKGKDLAWQERKATAFMIGPLHVGFGEEFYRRTDEYEHGRLKLGEAFATSGAAASPNMGYHSNPALAFLMTVFNVRLGMWLGNPRYTKQRSRWIPRLSLGPLVNELFGNTTDEARLVYLSDGGHFDNLGVYELIRRRCRFIIACDASADPHVRFDDLGSVFRKCRTDFGVDIALDTTSLRPHHDSAHSQTYCAVAHIEYSDGGRGTLLYIKASLTGRESVDVLNYAAAETTFPHQSTADQWFDESQFESYRRLGYTAARTILENAVRREGDTLPTLERIFIALRERWYPPTGIAATVFAEHGAALDRIIERIRTSPRLSFLDAQILPSWPELMEGTQSPPKTDLWLPVDAAARRDGFYLCQSVLQLMENVYLNLNLELNAEHPDNRGWMNLFRHWSWCGMLRVTWALTAATYGARFQTFCRERLDLVIGEVVADADLSKLNFVERELVAGSPHKTKAQAIKLRVPNPAAGGDPQAQKAIDFVVGFAIVNGDTLEYLRIQDHLRKMGLARKALLHLWDRQQVHELVELNGADDARRLRSEHEPSKGGDRLLRIFDSVRVERTATT